MYLTTISCVIICVVGIIVYVLLQKMLTLGVSRLSTKYWQCGDNFWPHKVFTQILGPLFTPSFSKALQKALFWMLESETFLIDLIDCCLVSFLYAPCFVSGTEKGIKGAAGIIGQDFQ